MTLPDPVKTLGLPKITTYPLPLRFIVAEEAAPEDQAQPGSDVGQSTFFRRTINPVRFSKICSRVKSELEAKSFMRVVEMAALLLASTKS